MAQFLFRLIPPRPTFPFDMADGEKQVMATHGSYWSELTQKGVCLIFGPVLDPQDPWGLAIVEAETDAAAQALFRANPAVAAGLCTFRSAPIHVAGFRQVGP